MRKSSVLLTIVVGLGFFVCFPYVLILLTDLFDLPIYNSIFLKISGTIFLMVGMALIIHTPLIFKNLGKGTPAPIEPSKFLVQKGLYKYTRNPMYWGYFSLILSEFLIFGHILLFFYFLASVLFVNIFVIFYEEPQLKNRFGQAYLDYCQKIPRWL